MLLRINNVRIPLVSEASLREASARRLGVKKQDIGSIRYCGGPLTPAVKAISL